MKHFAVLYETAPDYLERRGEWRAEHLALARAAAERGELVLGGAFHEPADGALIVFKGADDSAARAFVDADPYVKNGLIVRWRIREWRTVVGEGALTEV